MSCHNVLLYCGLEAKALVLFKGHAIAGGKNGKQEWVHFSVGASNSFLLREQQK